MSEVVNIVKTSNYKDDELSLLRGELDKIKSEVVLAQEFPTDHVEKQGSVRKVPLQRVNRAPWPATYDNRVDLHTLQGAHCSEHEA